jgi:hypothetical protein
MTALLFSKEVATKGDTGFKIELSPYPEEADLDDDDNDDPAVRLLVDLSRFRVGLSGCRGDVTRDVNIRELAFEKDIVSVTGR